MTEDDATNTGFGWEVLDGQNRLLGVGRVLSVIDSSTLILGDLPGIGEFNIFFIKQVALSKLTAPFLKI